MLVSARCGSSSPSITPDFILDVVPCKMSTEQVDILRKLSELVIASQFSNWRGERAVRWAVADEARRTSGSGRQSVKKACHCEPVRTLARQSVHKSYGFPRRCAPRNDRNGFADKFKGAARRSFPSVKKACHCEEGKARRGNLRSLTVRWKPR